MTQYVSSQRRVDLAAIAEACHRVRPHALLAVCASSLHLGKEIIFLCSFPSSWPVYTPALKMANWLESYAQSLELNVWTSATVLSVEPSTKGKRWSVRVVRGDGRERVFEVNHVVFAIGLGSGKPSMPNIPGQVCDMQRCLIQPWR